MCDFRRKKKLFVDLVYLFRTIKNFTSLLKKNKMVYCKVDPPFFYLSILFTLHNNTFNLDEQLKRFNLT